MAKRNTKSYLKLREQIQESFNFVYIVSQAVPCLKLQSSLVKKGVIQELPSPDYFTKPNPIEQIDIQVKGYKNELSKYILLSSFSYFESFVVDVVKEVIDFHGGETAFEFNAKKYVTKTMHNQSNNYTKEKTILSKTDPRQINRRQFATQKLNQENFIFPSALLTHLGVKALIQKLNNLKSVDIPKLMIDAFCMEWNENDISNFHTMREKRNNIAHGDTVKLDIKSVIQMNTQIRDIALKIDQHLIHHFFISEKHII